jgi:hypothetical protein
MVAVSPFLGHDPRRFTLDIFAGKFPWSHYHRPDIGVSFPTGLVSASVDHEAVIVSLLLFTGKKFAKKSKFLYNDGANGVAFGEFLP